MSGIKVGDRIYLSTTGYESSIPGIARSISGAFAVVEFPSGPIRCPLAQLSVTSPDERRRQKAKAEEVELQRLENERQLKAQAEETERVKAEKEQERIRVQEEERKAILNVLRQAMASNFLGVDELYKSKYSDDLEITHFLDAKAAFAREWIVANASVAGANGNLPDEEQLAAISSVHGNIQVVARAGSGKTTTLVNRSMFLLRHCGIAPSELLLLAFNRKAAMEIRRSLLLRLVPEAGEEIQWEIDKARKNTKRDRRPLGDVDAEAVEAVAEKFAGRLPHVMTFHALAYAVVHPQGQLLFDGQDSDSLGLSRAVQDVIDEFMQRPATGNWIQDLMLDHFREDWDKIVAGGFNLGMDDMLALKRSMPRETLGGELVKSRGEKAIADFLFEHDIPYKYERNHWWSGVNYKPDFTIFIATI